MTPTRKNFVLGLTSLAAMAGLVFMLILFGEMEGILKPRYALTLNCANAGGLRAGSTVELNGVPVGVVDRVRVEPGAEHPVRIVSLIDHGTLIPDDAVPYATSSLLGGSATLQLEGTAVTSLGTDGTARIDGNLRSRLIEQFTRELDMRMTPLAGALEDLRRLAVNLNDLVGPGEADEAGRVRNVRTAVELLNDVLVDVRTLSARATETLDRYGRLAAQIEGDSGRIADGLMPLMDEMALTLEEVRTLTRRAVEGEGTIAQLLNNPDLYRSLEDAAVNLDQTLLELRLLLERINREGARAVW